MTRSYDALIAHLAKVTAEEQAPSGLELTIELEDPSVDRRPEPPATEETSTEVDFEIPF